MSVYKVSASSCSLCCNVYVDVVYKVLTSSELVCASYDHIYVPIIMYCLRPFVVKNYIVYHIIHANCDVSTHTRLGFPLSEADAALRLWGFGWRVSNQSTSQQQLCIQPTRLLAFQYNVLYTWCFTPAWACHALSTCVCIDNKLEHSNIIIPSLSRPSVQQL